MPAGVDREDGDGIARLILRNEGRRNALAVDLFDDLDRELAALQHDPAVQVVVLTGHGSAFSVGADLAAPPHRRTLRGDSADADLSRLRRVGRIAERLHRLPQVTVAAVNGACAGAGLSLALACDLRIAPETAVFNTAFLAAGLSGDLGGIWFATRILGQAKARELFLLPERLPAREACAAGLVSRVTPAESFPTELAALTARLAASAPRALRAMKANLRDADRMPLADYLDVESERMVATFHTDDAREAARAFLERREPVFTGR
ncbi:MAG TPA: enoyl-CoA hydratase-related protein [Pseudonocardia sp.]|uniref:enoyl-CoA hydratase-related protein n=1 Tax=Pseudonocardia sp. TaxID=60912 RepID=UPI002B4AB377|nr:enoyl-CoA hydratase-related protein [Pseudonocardia sp.]HLU56739.1 enoyl-CoA hydratase-related protein [Pseudonocardia sp.]